MKNKLTITFSDTKGSRHFILNQIVKRTIIYSLIFIGVFIFICVFVILFLTNEVDKLEVRKEAIKEEMILEISRLQKDLDEQVLYYQSIKDRIGEIEAAMGIEPYEETITDIDLRIDYLKLTSAQRVILLDVVPNGAILKENNGISDRFGVRTHPISKLKIFHKGLDYRANLKTPIYAPANGIVEFAGMQDEKGFGSLVIIDHGYGFKTYYAHLDRKMIVKYGQFIKKGDYIANSGNTGLSTGPHLHYEVRFLGIPLDPINFVNWNMSNFEEIFSKEKKVPWGQLVNQAVQTISKVQKSQ